MAEVKAKRDGEIRKIFKSESDKFLSDFLLRFFLQKIAFSYGSSLLTQNQKYAII